jgi:hypothetical protein
VGRPLPSPYGKPHLLRSKPPQKLGFVFRTYRPVGLTCPSECPLLGNGCYAQSGPTSLHQRRAVGGRVSLREAFRQLPHGARVRHLVSGDLFQDDRPDLEAVAELREAHQARPDVQGWGYTHGWRRLDPYRLNLDNLTFNASCETEAEVRQALARGWPAVMVVPSDHPKRRAYEGFEAVVCPNQTVGLTCDRCGLCLERDRSRDGRPLVVAFRVHGAQRKRATQAVQKKVNHEQTTDVR